MNGRVSKKLRRLFRKEWKVYFNQMCGLPFLNRWYLAWDIIFKRTWGVTVKRR